RDWPAARNVRSSPSFGYRCLRHIWPCSSARTLKPIPIPLHARLVHAQTCSTSSTRTQRLTKVRANLAILGRKKHLNGFPVYHRGKNPLCFVFETKFNEYTGRPCTDVKVSQAE